MKIALIQTNTGRDMSRNIKELEALLADISEADLVITPECSNMMGYKPGIDRLAKMEADALVGFCRNWAKSHQVNFCIGSALVEAANGEIANRQILIDRQGEILSYYDKIHMFDVDLPSGESYRESDRCQAGGQALVSDIDGVGLGHSICFDLRFAALYRDLAQAGAALLLVPAAFTETTGRGHWEVLLRARAIETGSFVIAPGQCGNYTHHDGDIRKTWGHSMVISPWGEVLLELDDKPAVGIVEIKLDDVQNTRNQIPALQLGRAFKSARRA